MNTDTLADTAARITALRAMRQLARETGDAAKAIEFSNEIYELCEQQRRAKRAQQQEAGT